jgi:hypothetical protein
MEKIARFYRESCQRFTVMQYVLVVEEEEGASVNKPNTEQIQVCVPHTKTLPIITGTGPDFVLRKLTIILCSLRRVVASNHFGLNYIATEQAKLKIESIH